MHSPLSRRTFFGATAATVGALAWNASAWERETSPAQPPAERPDSLFLTWHRDPTTTMTIQWVGADLPMLPHIQFRPQDGRVWQMAPLATKPYTDTDLKVFRCELTGLTPGGEYEFQIGDREPTYRFRTMPAKATDAITFVSGGDAGVDNPAILSNQLAAKQDPYFVLMAGDLAYDNGAAPAVFHRYLKNYSQHLIDSQGRLIPMLATIGNHEVKGGYRATRADSPSYLALFDGFFAEQTYGVLDIGDYLSLVLLDTGHIAPVEGEQTDWLERTLADRQDRPHLIVANHVPAYPSYRSPTGSMGNEGTGENQRRAWCPLFEKYRVDVVLEHHDHTFKKTHPLIDGLAHKDGVIYLGDGSWGKLRPPASPEQRPYLAKVAGAYHVTTHRLEGDTRFHVAMESSGKLADVTMTRSKRI